MTKERRASILALQKHELLLEIIQIFIASIGTLGDGTAPRFSMSLSEWSTLVDALEINEGTDEKDLLSHRLDAHRSPGKGRV